MAGQGDIAVPGTGLKRIELTADLLEIEAAGPTRLCRRRRSIHLRSLSARWLWSFGRFRGAPVGFRGGAGGLCGARTMRAWIGGSAKVRRGLQEVSRFVQENDSPEQGGVRVALTAILTSLPRAKRG